MKLLNQTYHYQASSEHRFHRLTLVIFVCLMFLICMMLFSNDESAMSPEPTEPPKHLDEQSLEILSATAQPSVAPFPRKIWQTTKNGPAGFSDEDKEAIKSWTRMNHDWRYESITQYSAENYVRERFASRPDLVEIFTNLQEPILRADMIRYLVLLADGGLYSDLDTASLKPIDDWIPKSFQDLANVVIGIEYDRLEGDRWVDWSLDLQFSTWTILAKPGHSLLELTVGKVVRGLKDLALKQGKPMSGIEVTFREVLDVTGPAIFTEAVFELLSQQTRTNFTWLNVTHLTAPRLVGDILILPITAFGCGQSHSHAGVPDDGSALVQHLFRGSWKQDHPIEGTKHRGSAQGGWIGEDKEEEINNHVTGTDEDQKEDTKQEEPKAKDDSGGTNDEGNAKQEETEVKEDTIDATVEDNMDKEVKEEKAEIGGTATTKDLGSAKSDESGKDEKEREGHKEKETLDEAVKDEGESKESQMKDKDDSTAKGNSAD